MTINRVFSEISRYALNAGAFRTAVIDIPGITFLTGTACGNCPEHGRNLSCPPHIPPPRVFREETGLYTGGLLFQVRVPAGRDNYTTVWAGSSLVHQIVLEAEQRALALGAARVRGLIAGCCKLCHPCAGGDGVCRFPERARSSLEAVGIDVAGTCAGVGWEIRFPVEDYVDWTGLVLVAVCPPG